LNWKIIPYLGLKYSSCCLLIISIVQQLVEKLGSEFPVAYLLDDFGFIYLHYWQAQDCNDKFDQYLQIVKTHDEYPKKFSTAEFPEDEVDHVLSVSKVDI
jgi:hypothetical protein